MMYAAPLSKRELEVLRLISSEYCSHEIADHLFISHHTVLSHRKNLLSKLKARNTAGLVRRGFELGILHIKTFGNNLDHQFTDSAQAL